MNTDPEPKLSKARVMDMIAAEAERWAQLVATLEEDLMSTKEHHQAMMDQARYHLSLIGRMKK